jgi:hypothetical protein
VRRTPRCQQVLFDFRHATALFDGGKDGRPVAAHASSVGFHHVQIGTDRIGQVRFVDHKDI